MGYERGGEDIPEGVGECGRRDGEEAVACWQRCAEESLWRSRRTGPKGKKKKKKKKA